MPTSRGSESNLIAVSSVDVGRRLALRHACALGLIRIVRVRRFEIRAEAAVLQHDRAVGAVAKRQTIGRDGRLRIVAARERARELARRIAIVVRAADEGAVLAEAQRELALAAERADARIAAVFLRREDVRAQHFVQRVEHLGDAQIADVGDGAVEVFPEVAHQLLPIEFAGGDFVELLFEVGGEIVFDIFAEEVFQERGDETAAVIRDEAVLVHLHVIAFAQLLEDRRVGRRPADAELFQFLDEAGFRIARRRLGEMLIGFHVIDVDGFALLQLRQAAVFFVFLVVAAFLIEFQEAVEENDLAGGAQFDLAGRLGEIDAGALDRGRFHLRRDRALPDEIVKPRLIAIEDAAVAACWWDRSGGSLRALPARS